MRFSPNFPENFSDGVSLMVLGDCYLPDVSNALLYEVLESVGFNKKNLYISNVFWEVPESNAITHFFCETDSLDQKAKQFPLYKDKYLKAEWTNQIFRLQDELELIKPELILAVGEIPLWALTGSDNIIELRGRPKIIAGPVKYKYSIVFPVLNPTDILDNEESLIEFIKDIERVRELSDTVAWDWPNMFGDEYYAAFGN